MKINYIAADSRGQVDFGWLKSNHTYSFGKYWNPDRMGFGALRVVNDDWVEPGAGFGKHPHDNMEIISIPLSGKLIHRDSMGNEKEIIQGEVQAMSAGKGVIHSEMNGSETESVAFFQIWIETREMGIKQSYSQKKIDKAQRQDKWQLIVAPDHQAEDVVKIHQDAWMYLGDFRAGDSIDYTLNKSGNGVFLMVISGQVKIGQQILGSRDALELSEADSFTMQIIKDSSLLVIEVPLKDFQKGY